MSRTLDFAFADWSTAQAFKKITSLSTFAEKKIELNRAADELLKRSNRAVRALFNPAYGLMVPRDRSGGFSRTFMDIEWGNGYTEGNAWHHSFPPFAVDTLVELHNGKENLQKKLKRLISMPSNFMPGSYHMEIHEMKEGRAVAMGQYAHNNQPSHHLLYLFALVGDRVSTEENVRLILDRAYGRDFFAGDEDNGEQGAWYVLSALGLYSVAPGSPDYVFGSPLFRHVRVRRKIRGEDKDLDIIAFGTDAETVHVSSTYFDRQEIHGPTISNDLLQRGGILQFIMEGEMHEGSRVIDALQSKQSLLALYRNNEVRLTRSPEESVQVEQLQTKLQQLQGKYLSVKVFHFNLSSAEKEYLRHHVSRLEQGLEAKSELIDTNEAVEAGNPIFMGMVILVSVALFAAISIRQMQKRGINGRIKSDVYTI